jgi:hypothetical protein
VTRLVLAFCAWVAVGPAWILVVTAGRWVDRRRRLRRFHHQLETHLREHTTWRRG